MSHTIQNTSDLLSYLIAQSDVKKDWFGFLQQRITAISLAHEIAKIHANTMTPEEVVSYAMELNQTIFDKIIRRA